MSGLDEQLNGLLAQVHKLVPSTEQKTAMTKAGASVYRDELEAATKAQHYSSHKDETYGHMADNITAVSTDIDGESNGNSVAGWNNPYHAANARRLNDGTIKYRGDHFVTNVQTSNAVREKVLKAELNVYKKFGGDS
ncbi:hypothetical protein KY41_10615 [Latilactobacillus sakei]|uniref:HK97 gp10 family phage protein n=1 Tax=Latilactobacillus TaxID=2767885 RepID=UPI000500FD7F|nr:HK97 gp10 family phage protein [Latilactobacillus curvatus]KGB13896.1 hypothetical protein KY41_10615 [Latilactobacillus sakei]QEA49917.1 phage tail protein [Latilactobacillus curvatus]